MQSSLLSSCIVRIQDQVTRIEIGALKFSLLYSSTGDYQRPIQAQSPNNKNSVTVPPSMLASTAKPASFLELMHNRIVHAHLQFLSKFCAWPVWHRNHHALS